MASSGPSDQQALLATYPVAYDIPLSEVRSPRIHQLDAYWHSKCPPAGLARRADIDPAELKPLLPYLMLVDLEYDPFRVRYRLSGTMVGVYNGELTNCYLDEAEGLPLEMRQRNMVIYAAAARERRAVFCRDYMVMKSGALYPYFGAIWPLADGGARINKCVSMEDYPDGHPHNADITQSALPYEPDRNG